MKLGFEQIDKRFNGITGLITAGFAMLTILVAVYTFLG
jgi:hypothetical protein